MMPAGQTDLLSLSELYCRVVLDLKKPQSDVIKTNEKLSRSCLIIFPSAELIIPTLNTYEK